MELTETQKDILDHTAHRAPSGHYCGDSEDMQKLVRLGLMMSQGKKPFCPDEYFSLTHTGRQALESKP